MGSSILQPCEEMNCTTNEKIVPQVVGILNVERYFIYFFLIFTHLKIFFTLYSYHA